MIFVRGLGLSFALLVLYPGASSSGTLLDLLQETKGWPTNLPSKSWETSAYDFDQKQPTPAVINIVITTIVLIVIRML